MILVTGATGTNGLEIVKLLSRSGVRCRSLVRNPQKISTFSNLPFVEVVQGDLSRPESLAPALEGVDKALLCSSIGPDLVELQGNFIRAAKEAGVRHVVKFSAWTPTQIPHGAFCGGIGSQNENWRTRASRSRICSRSIHAG